ncbi:MAG: aminoacetone oxidase family FAD-binding enzyme [Candidatus Marinimicrobia bacterium]|nr:aminoacetone oxidase family FAD-binding enzyme [Candidatus Neomarinimicrobiota bacterium]
MSLIEVIFLLLVGAIGTLIGWIVSAKFQKNKIIGAEGNAKSIIERAHKEAKSIEKEIFLEAKDASFKMKNEIENQLNDKSKLIQERENSLNQRELGLDRKSDMIDKKESNINSSEEDLKERSRLLKKKDERFTELIEEQNSKLANISQMSQEEAKELLMGNLMEKARQDSARKVKEIKDESVRNAVFEAKKIIVSAIQRCAVDHSSENSVSVVHLPSDSMKGRIIGREGRNIRSFESVTGIEVIIDDTPEAVVISGFVPVRREVARLALETLVTDGRIHPARIEEVVKKTKADVTEVMKRYVTSNNAELKTGTKVLGFKVEDGKITGVETNSGVYTAKVYILATGGSSYQKTGSTGDGVGWLEMLGHTVHKANPNIVPLIVEDKWVKALSGTTLSFMKITFGADRTKVAGRFSSVGKILFTHFGVSGPLILNASHEVKKLLGKGPVQATIDMYPDTEIGTIRNRVLEIFNRNKNKTLKNVLKEFVPAGMDQAVIAQFSSELTNMKVHSVGKKERYELVDSLKAMPLTITGTMGMDWAVISDGGVALTEIDTKTMQSPLHEKLYLTGDVLHVTRPSGGYSLQLCWTTGYVAGSHV